MAGEGGKGEQKQLLPRADLESRHALLWERKRAGGKEEKTYRRRLRLRREAVICMKSQIGNQKTARLRTRKILEGGNRDDQLKLNISRGSDGPLITRWSETRNREGESERDQGEAALQSRES